MNYDVSEALPAFKLLDNDFFFEREEEFYRDIGFFLEIPQICIIDEEPQITGDWFSGEGNSFMTDVRVFEFSFRFTGCKKLFLIEPHFDEDDRREMITIDNDHIYFLCRFVNSDLDPVDQKKSLVGPLKHISTKSVKEVARMKFSIIKENADRINKNVRSFNSRMARENLPEFREMS